MGIKKVISNNFYLYKAGFRYCPSAVITIVVQNILNAILNILATVWFTERIFNSMSGNGNLDDFILIILKMAVAYILINGFDQIMKNYYMPKMKLVLQERMQKEFFNKASELDLECYDSAEFYNDFIWAMDDADQRVFGAIENVGMMIFQLIFCSGVLRMIMKYDVSLLIMILLAIFLSTALNIWRVKVCIVRDQELKIQQRKLDYYSRVFYLRDYAKELRTSEVSGILYQEFDETYDKINDLTLKYGKKTMLINFLMRLSTTSLFDVGVVIIAAYKLVTKQIEVSVFVVLINVVWQLFFKINGFINGITKCYEDALYCDKIRRFVERKSKIIDKKDGKKITSFKDEIRVKNLCFSYGKDRVLNNINMQIKSGEKIAIVGYNGSGKSTFVKLLMRLYDPDSGEILIDGVNVKEYKLSNYKQLFGAVFQDFKLFAVKLAENIAMDIDYDKQDIRTAMGKSGFSKEGIDIEDVVTKEFNNEGLILSGGEQQKIAIARLFAKKFPILVMDEPSSALDPVVEYEINKKIFKEMDKKTIVFVSHRLTTACLADKIFMFKDGNIIEAGTHEELLERKGEYAKMYGIQAEKYMSDSITSRTQNLRPKVH